MTTFVRTVLLLVFSLSIIPLLGQTSDSKNTTDTAQTLHADIVTAANKGDWKELYAALLKARDAGLTETIRMAEDKGYFVWIERQRYLDSRPTPNPTRVPMSQQMPIGRSIKGKTVYVTPNGKKYHASHCRHAKSGRGLSVQSAVLQGYTACSVCGGGGI